MVIILLFGTLYAENKQMSPKNKTRLIKIIHKFLKSLFFNADCFFLKQSIAKNTHENKHTKIKNQNWTCGGSSASVVYLSITPLPAEIRAQSNKSKNWTTETLPFEPLFARLIKNTPKTTIIAPTTCKTDVVSLNKNKPAKNVKTDERIYVAPTIERSALFKISSETYHESAMINPLNAKIKKYSRLTATPKGIQNNAKIAQPDVNNASTADVLVLLTASFLKILKHAAKSAYSKDKNISIINQLDNSIKKQKSIVFNNVFKFLAKQKQAHRLFLSIIHHLIDLVVGCL